MSEERPALPERLYAVGLAQDAVDDWLAARPDEAALAGVEPSGYDAVVGPYLRLGDSLWRRFPPRAGRGGAEEETAEAIKAALREARQAFLRRCAGALYADLTNGYRDFVRLDQLLDRTAARYPGLVPGRAELQADAHLPLKEKEGVEIDQATFLAQMLSHPKAGAHLVEAMLRPRTESLRLLDGFMAAGEVDLGTAHLRREGNLGYLELRNDRYLNAEDDTTVDALEIGTDLALLDPSIAVGVLRGGVVSHERHRGRRVFNAGINLTRLYHGRIPLLYYLTREMGFVNKLYRGVASGDWWPGEPEMTLEKPWLGAVDGFAIGGGCQLLPVLDHVVAETGVYLNLPARKEGIIPGVANLRLQHMVGDRLTRQAVLFEREFAAQSPEGRLLCDTVVPPAEMDQTLRRVAEGLTSSGLVSVVGNRRAIRLGQEPRSVFQAYMALYARDQAACHFSPALVRNLEQNWQADGRTP